MPESAPLPALPMPGGVLHASMISASTMVLSSRFVGWPHLQPATAQSQFARARPRRMSPCASRLWHQPCSAIAILDDVFVYAQLFPTITIPWGRYDGDSGGRLSLAVSWSRRQVSLRPQSRLIAHPTVSRLASTQCENLLRRPQM